MERQFELMLASGKRVMWNGRNGVDAAHRYVDCHAGASVTAWRTPRVSLSVGIPEGC